MVLITSMRTILQDLWAMTDHISYVSTRCCPTYIQIHYLDSTWNVKDSLFDCLFDWNFYVVLKGISLIWRCASPMSEMKPPLIPLATNKDKTSLDKYSTITGLRLYSHVTTLTDLCWLRAPGQHVVSSNQKLRKIKKSRVWDYEFVKSDGWQTCQRYDQLYTSSRSWLICKGNTSINIHLLSEYM